MDYEASKKVRFESIGKVKDMDKLGARLKVLLAAEDRGRVSWCAP